MMVLAVARERVPAKRGWVSAVLNYVTVVNEAVEEVAATEEHAGLLETAMAQGAVARI